MTLTMALALLFIYSCEIFGIFKTNNLLYKIYTITILIVILY